VQQFDFANLLLKVEINIS